MATEKMLIISTHLDDAVFSLGQTIAESPNPAIVTVCAGIPPAETPPSRFDEAAGFGSGAEAITARRQEDRAAAEKVGAVPIHLNVLSDEYARGAPRRRESFIAALASAFAVMAKDRVIYAPLGLRHPDHELTAEAVRWLRTPKMEIFAYADLPYFRLWPEFAEPAAAAWGLDTPGAGAAIVKAGAAEKADAVECYPSQLPGMELTALEGDEIAWPVP
jgi:LmbE family N-acetylglucosaminyl deacetylase